MYGTHAEHDARTGPGAGAAEGRRRRSKLRRNAAVEKVRPNRQAAGTPNPRIEPGRRIIESVYAELTDKGRADVTTP